MGSSVIQWTFHKPIDGTAPICGLLLVKQKRFLLCCFADVLSKKPLAGIRGLFLVTLVMTTPHGR